MRTLTLLAALCFHQAWAGYRYLELHAPPSRGDSLPVPLYLAVPDTLGSLAVLPFLESPSGQAQKALGGDWQLQPLAPAEKRFLLAARAFLEGRLGEARDGFAAARGLRPSPSLQGCLRVNTAVLLYLMGLPAEAEKDLRRALNAVGNPVAEGAWRNLYSIYLGKRDFAKAHGLVEDVLHASPKNKWALLAKGYLLRMLRPEEEWENFLREKSSWRDSLFEIQIAYGRFLKEQGQWKEAVKYYNRGLEGEPAHGFAWLDLADAYYRMGYLVFAEQCLRSAFRYGVHDPYVYELYARILQDFGESAGAERAAAAWKAAERILEEGFPKDMQSRSMARLLYHLYCRNGKVEAARNLRAGFWFHFTGPAPPGAVPRLGVFPAVAAPGLTIRWGVISFPLARNLKNSDFFEPF